MATVELRIPPGPQEAYRTTDDLLEWMSNQFTKFGDTYKAFVYGTDVYATKNLEFAHHVLVGNWQNYVKGQFIKRVAFLLGNGLMVSEGELWKGQRRMAQPAFQPNAIAALIGLVTTVNSKLLNKWQLAAQRHESVNVTRDVSSIALEVVLRSILGADYDQVGPHFDLLSEERARDLAFTKAFRALGNIIFEVAGRRRQESKASSDMLGSLMQARDPRTGRLMQDHQLINEVLTLIVAGHETTASTLSWMWYLISQHADVEERLTGELSNFDGWPEFEDLPKFPFSRQILEECMRLYPAGWLMTRRALQDDKVAGYFIPSGTEVYVSPYFIQRDPNVWQEPERFNPDRFRPDPSPHCHRDRLAMMPFSAGPRNCIGSLFARVEMQIHLLMISKHLRLKYVQSRPLELDAGVNLRNKYEFIMYPEARTC